MRTRRSGRAFWTAGGSGEGAAQALLVDPPEVVLAAVDEGDRDLLAVGVHQLGRGGDVDLVVRRADLGADPLDDLAGVVAQVAAGLGVER